MSYPIKQGGKAVISVKLRDLNDDPVPLAQFTAISTCFRNYDGTDLSVDLTAGIAIDGDPLLGKLLITLTAAQTTLLYPVDDATMQLSLTTTGDPEKIDIVNAYSVLATLC